MLYLLLVPCPCPVSRDADVHEMLEQEDIDLENVCTTARMRLQLVQDVARAGARRE